MNVNVAELAPDHRIAIVGRAGRFPAARNVDEYWSMLAQGRCATQRLSEAELLAQGVSRKLLADPAYVRMANILPDMECFDAGFFGFSAREAAILDPQHRHFLECGWEALEDAGHMPERFEGRIGVFAGSGMQAYLPFNLLSNPDLAEEVGLFLLRHTGNDKDFLPTRLSYLLNLTGPSMAIQTACSTSLVAVHTAIGSLLNMECDMAIAGGVTIELPHRTGYKYVDGEILSPDGFCRAFDDDSKGTVFGSGVGLVVLRRYADAVRDGDDIKAVILASAINNDGASKASYLAPSVDGQAEAAAEALALSGIGAADISYIETHGTGTPIGDPIELSALQQVYGTAPKGSIGIGSVKTNIGHLDTAAGTASLIKVIESLRHRTLPASLHLKTPNSRFDFAGSPFKVVSQGTEWQSEKPRRAAINSLGVGGTNAHIIIEEAPRSGPSAETNEWNVFAFSARTKPDLERTRARWGDFLQGPTPAAQDIAYTLREGRRAFGERFTVAARNVEELRTALTAKASALRQQGHATATNPRIVFLYPGGGAQYPGAGTGLMTASPAFAGAVHECFSLLPPTAPADLYEVMFESDAADEEAREKLRQSSYAIPALFILEYAYTRHWEAWGIRPDAVLAHSVGEYAGAVTAGALQLADALKIVTLRGRIMDDAPRGAMTSVPLDVQRVHELIGETLDIAAVNTDTTTVVSGPVAEIEQLEKKLAGSDHEARRVRIDVAGHSRQLDSQLDRFRAGFAGIKFGELTVPMLSSLRGGWAEGDDLRSEDYWVQHLRRTVRFADAVKAALETPDSIFIEVGPGQTLGPLVASSTAATPARATLSSSPHARDNIDEVGAAFAAFGGLWANGVAVDWSKAVPMRGKRASLPTYAFAKERHWIEPGRGAADNQNDETPHLTRRLDPSQWFEKLGWREQQRSSPAAALAGDWLVLAGNDPFSVAALDHLQANGARITLVKAGERFEKGADGYAVRPDAQEDFDALAGALGNIPERILCLWGLDPALDAKTFAGAYLLCRMLQQADCGPGTHLAFAARGTASVQGEPIPNPALAALLGPVRVAPREIPGLTSVLVDIDAEVGVDTLLAEIAAAGDTDHVALRGSASRFVHARSAEPGHTPSALPRRLRKGGTYLITGGTGGIGREMARWLASAAGAKLILLSRTARENEALRREIETQGGQVMFVAADLRDADQTQAALKAATDDFGPVHGVIHAAGILDDVPLALQPLEAALAVMEPKLGGAEILDRLFPEGTVDFFAVMSSSSVLLGGAGQTSYAGANAALEAIAASRKDGFSIAWGAWRDVGMAARTYGAGTAGEDSDPLLGVRRDSADGSILFETIIDPETDWRVAEHVVGGSPVLPGTAYMEIADAAARAVMRARPSAITALQFLAPMVFENLPRRVGISLRETGDGYDLTIESTSAGQGDAIEHMRARIVRDDDAAGNRAPIPMPDWPVSSLSGKPLQGKLIDFGERWKCVGDIRVHDAEVAAGFALADTFRADLSAHPLHPALLDMAATIGMASMPLDGTIYAPMSVGRIQVFGPLPARITSHATRIAGEPGRFASFNVSICDEAGNVLIRLEDFALRAVAAESLGKLPAQSSLSAQLLSSGIRRSDAQGLFARVFDHPARQILVSPVSIDLVRVAMMEKVAPAKRTTAKTESKIADPVAARLASIWSDILGTPEIGLEDDFFALGGHSLNAIRMFTRVRKEFGISLPLSKLFEAPRLAALADVLREQIVPEVAAEAAVPEAAPETEAPAAGEIRVIDMTEGQREIAGSLIVDPSSSLAYNLSFSLHVANAVDAAALQRALKALMKRHDVFRASLDLDRMALTIHPEREIELGEHDLTSLEGAEKENARDALMRTASQTPFDLVNGPLLRVMLLKLSAEQSEIVLIVHHIVCDGWSMGVVLRDLAELYSAELAGRRANLPPAQSIAELVEAEAEWQAGAAAQEHRDFWLKKYAGPLPVLDLPFDKPRPAMPSTEAARVVTLLDRPLENALRARATEAGTPLRNLLFATFRYYLARLANTTDVVVGLPTAGQVAHGLDNTVGHGINLLPIRGTIDFDCTLADLIRQTRHEVLEAVEHQNYTHGALIRDLHVSRDSSRHLLAPVVVNIDGLADLGDLPFGTGAARIEVNSTGHEFFDLFFNQFDAPGRVELTWNYKTSLFDDRTIELHAQNFVHLLREIANNPNALKSPVSTMLRGDVSHPASGTHDDPGAAGPQTVTEVFRAIARAHADNVAQRFGRQTMSYRDLDARSDALAAWLVNEGVRPGELVGISSHRSLSLLVAVLGVLKAGAGYVPFDVNLPDERLQFMARDTGIRILLGDCPAAAADGVRIIGEAEYPSGPAALPDVPVTGESIAYVMFTSGTTGVPKGVVLPHRSIIRMLRDNHWVELSEKTVTLHSSAFAFDTSIIDIFGALLHGGTVVVPPEGKLSIADLSQAIESHDVNTLWLTSGLFHAVADSRPEAFAKVWQVIVGGDVVSPSHVARVKAVCPQLVVINGYGPTESNVTNAHTVTAADLESGMPLPIGPAIAGTQIYILDQNLYPVPPGFIGELCIAGRGLALGYWNRRELTAEKFIQAPWDPSLRLYKSGDLAMDPGNGVVRFYGRADTQVKIRGFRIELTEVEAALDAHPSIRQAVVMAVVPERQTDKVLAAYYVPEGSAPDARELKAYLSKLLPDFAVPSFFIGVDEIPLTSNGKADRRKLPPLPSEASAENADMELRGETEKRLAAIWSDILGINVLSAQANFFELGGHSLLAVRLFDRVRREFGRDLPISTLFRNQTVRQLAATVGSVPDESEELRPDADWDTTTIIDGGPGRGSRPLFIVGGVGGNVNNLQEFAKFLGRSRAVIGFQTRGVQGHNPHKTIEDMAADNIRYMRRHQPKGPYLLAGYSGGAYTAFEMTRQLEAAGEKVERLFVLDTYAPGFARDFRPAVKLGIGERLLSEIELLRDEGFSFFYERLSTKLRHKLMRGPWLKLVKRTSLSHFRYEVMREVWMAAARQYVGGSINAPVTLFYTRPRQLLQRRALELNPMLGWNDVSQREPVETSPVSGDHLDMLNGENARSIAEKIDARIGSI